MPANPPAVPGAPLIPLDDDDADPFLAVATAPGVPGFSLPQEVPPAARQATPAPAPLGIAPSPGDPMNQAGRTLPPRPPMPPLDGTHGYACQPVVSWHAAHGTDLEILNAYGARDLRKIAGKLPGNSEFFERVHALAHPGAPPLGLAPKRAAGTGTGDEAARVIYEAFAKAAKESGEFPPLPTWDEVCNPKEDRLKTVFLKVASAAAVYFQG